MMATQDKKRGRAANFSEAELTILGDEMAKNHKLLTSKHSDTVTNRRKQDLWQSITDSINAVSETRRTVKQVRKKWETLSSQVKSKGAKNKREAAKTGGGPPPPPLTPMEENILGILGDTATVGIAGSIDSSMPEEEHEHFPVLKSPEGTREDAADEEREEEEATRSQPQPQPGQMVEEEEEDADNAENTSCAGAAITVSGRKRGTANSSQRLVEIEEERLETEKKRLKYERKRYKLEKKLHVLKMKKYGQD